MGSGEHRRLGRVVLDLDESATVLVEQAVVIPEKGATVLRNAIHQLRHGRCLGRRVHVVELRSDVEESMVPKQVRGASISGAQVHPGLHPLRQRSDELLLAGAVQVALTVPALENAVLPPEVLHLRTLVSVDAVVHFPQVQSAVQPGKVYHLGGVLIRHIGERDSHVSYPQVP